MNKELRNQIAEMLPVLWDGIKYARTVPAKDAEPVLGDVLNSLDAIGEALRGALSAARFGDYEARLEELKLCVDALYGSLEDGLHTKDNAEQIKHKLNLLRRELREESEVRLEVVFFPYNASMWDSLESIWSAANEDPECEAVVVPIPYYDRNSDGSLGEMHYEGDRFPPHVPVTRWQAYDIAARKPDIAYVHNVYDGFNFITTVDPSYYTKELKKHVNTLVYIPYYVLGQGSSEHFYQLPGIANADVVIAQSEYERERLIKHWPAEKIAALGSPKADKTLWFDQKPPEMPKEWAPLLKGKRVVLYNTSIGAMLLNNARMLDKMLETFKLFQARGDVALLWRPHPLIRETIKSMRPWMLKSYEALEEWYKASGIGVFDDSPDFHRAMALSDMYFGDMSSLVALYGMTGKPILIQNAELAGRDESAVQFSSGLVEGGDIWLASYYFNGLFRGNPDGGEAEFLACFPGEVDTACPLYKEPARYGDKLVFLPVQAEEIAVYDTVSGEIVKYPIPAPGEAYDERSKFHCAAVYGDCVYMLGSRYPGIARLNMKTGETALYSDWMTPELYACCKLPEHLFGNACCVVGDTLYAACAGRPAVLQFDLKTGKGNLVPINAPCGGFTGIFHDGAYFWLVPFKKGPVVRWDAAQNAFETVGGYPDSFDQNVEIYFETARHCGDTLYLGSCHTQHTCALLRLDMRTGAMREVKFPGISKPYVAIIGCAGDTAYAARLDAPELYAIRGEEPEIESSHMLCAELDTAALAAEALSAPLNTPWMLNETYGYVRSESLPLPHIRQLLDNFDAARALKDGQKAAFGGLCANADGTAGREIHTAVKRRVRGERVRQKR